MERKECNLVQYLRKNGNFEDRETHLKLELEENRIKVNCIGKNGIYIWLDEENVEAFAAELIEIVFGLSVQFCSICGKPIFQGYVKGQWPRLNWFSCDDCFEKHMNDTYGHGKWKLTKREGSNGGFYEYLSKNDKSIDTGIYYCHW